MDDASVHNRAESFLKTAHLYRLGELITEQPHPLTVDLSTRVHHSITESIGILKKVDLEALTRLVEYEQSLQLIKQSIADTWSAGGRVFLCGCGATGRLSLTLEYLWRAHGDGEHEVLSFMAGGDVALVHAVEGFEDYPQYGARQLEEMGFGPQDLLIASTEGGETPWVIGAVERAAELSQRAPLFLFCNPSTVLERFVERSRRVILNPNVLSISLEVGPMALAGSTRMQASTALQLAIGYGLFSTTQSVEKWIQPLAEALSDSPEEQLAEFVRAEARVYEQNNFVLYATDAYAITVFTDTTERAPTFSLPAFNNQKVPQKLASLAYVMLSGADSVQSAWEKLLLRPARPLMWVNLHGFGGEEYLAGFDFSRQAEAYRKNLTPHHDHYIFQIEKSGDEMSWGFQGHSFTKRIKSLHPVLEHTYLKLLLNMHSTLVMGLLGRYESNLMTWVTTTNGKLIDRATRYVLHLLKQKGVSGVSYEQVVHEIFAEMEKRQENEPIVLKVASRYDSSIVPI